MNQKYVKFCPICNQTKQNMDWCNNEKYKEFSKGYHFVFKPKDDIEICPSCKQGKLVDSPLTFEEFKLVDDVSDSDRQFLEAMIKLKQDDTIEFQLKIQQFKTQLQQQKQIEEKGYIVDNAPKCPTCQSTNLKKITATSKAMNTALFGLFGTKRHKTYHCNNCGYEW
jgi:hypothetical protein